MCDDCLILFVVLFSERSSPLELCQYNGGSTSPGGNGRSFQVRDITSSASTLGALSALMMGIMAAVILF